MVKTEIYPGKLVLRLEPSDKRPFRKGIPRGNKAENTARTWFEDLLESEGIDSCAGADLGLPKVGLVIADYGDIRREEDGTPIGLRNGYHWPEAAADPWRILLEKGSATFPKLPDQLPTAKEHNELRAVAETAKALLARLDTITTRSFQQGGERKEREALREALVDARLLEAEP